jgi:hypothetical protein
MPAGLSYTWKGDFGIIILIKMEIQTLFIQSEEPNFLFLSGHE